MNNEGKIVGIALPVISRSDGNQVTLYTPALDLCTSGDTAAQARENFHDAVQIFIEHLIENDSFEDVLSELGWSFEEEDKVTPPAWECDRFEEVKFDTALAI